MSLTDDRPRTNGHKVETPVTNDVPRFDLAGAEADYDRVPEDARIVQDLPSIRQLNAEITESSKVVAAQDHADLRNAMTVEEIRAERKVASEHRAAMLRIQRERNAAEIERERARLRLEIQLEKQKLDDELEASKAQALLRKLTNPVSYLASQMRTRRWSLALAATPAIVGVLIGAIQSQDAWVQVFHASRNLLLDVVLYGWEPLATLPLVAILLYEARNAGGSSRTMRDTWLARPDLQGATRDFGVIKTGLLAMSVLINVGGHLFLGDLAGIVWMWVPAAIVVSLSLVPRLAAGFGERIMTAKTDAELGAPAGTLPSNVAKVIRQKRTVEQAITTGTFRGQIDAGTQLPSIRGVQRTLAEAQGAAGMPDAYNVVSAIRLDRGIDE